jgi:hypothetical protein
MKREASVRALLKKAGSEFSELRKAYEASLNEKVVREDFKVSIKNVFENLRSSLDYLAHDIFETHCSATRKPSKLYFPIRHTSHEFNAAIGKDYPGLPLAAKPVFCLLESIQPYKDPWLGQFSKLNNHNKHQDLVEQERTETRHVTVSGGGGSVSWNSGVVFSGNVSVMGVPIDPRTQLPVPSNLVKTQVIVWVDFRFKELGLPVLSFTEQSIQRVGKLFHQLLPLV